MHGGYCDPNGDVRAEHCNPEPCPGTLCCDIFLFDVYHFIDVCIFIYNAFFFNFSPKSTL